MRRASRSQKLASTMKTPQVDNSAQKTDIQTTRAPSPTPPPASAVAARVTMIAHEETLQGIGPVEDDLPRSSPSGR